MPAEGEATGGMALEKPQCDQGVAEAVDRTLGQGEVSGDLRKPEGAWREGDQIEDRVGAHNGGDSARDLSRSM